MIVPPPCALAQIVTRVESVFKVAMPVAVASLLNVFDVLNLSIDAFGLPLSCLQLGSFFNQLPFRPCSIDRMFAAPRSYSASRRNASTRYH